MVLLVPNNSLLNFFSCEEKVFKFQNEAFFSFQLPKLCTYFHACPHILQLGFFSYHLMPRPGFEPASVTGCCANWATMTCLLPSDCLNFMEPNSFSQCSDEHSSWKLNNDFFLWLKKIPPGTWGTIPFLSFSPFPQFRPIYLADKKNRLGISSRVTGWIITQVKKRGFLLHTMSRYVCIVLSCLYFKCVHLTVLMLLIAQVGYELRLHGVFPF